MTIYCHGMSSAEPWEYLTLPAGDSENYAEIYDKRLANYCFILGLYSNIFLTIE